MADLLPRLYVAECDDLHRQGSLSEACEGANQARCQRMRIIPLDLLSKRYRDGRQLRTLAGKHGLTAVVTWINTRVWITTPNTEF